MLIRIILTFIFSVIAATIIQDKTLGRWFKIASVCACGLSCAVVLCPQVANRVAAVAGVGRGADLIIYICIAIGGYLTILFYLRLKNTERRIARLVQYLAIEKQIAKTSGACGHGERDN